MPTNDLCVVCLHDGGDGLVPAFCGIETLAISCVVQPATKPRNIKYLASGKGEGGATAIHTNL